MSNFDLSVFEYSEADGYFAEISGRIKAFDDEADDQVVIGEFKGYRLIPYSKEDDRQVSICFDLDMDSITYEFSGLFDRKEVNLWNEHVLQRFPDLEAFHGGIFLLSEVKIKPEFRGQGHFEELLRGLTSLMNLQVVVLKAYPLQWELDSE